MLTTDRADNMKSLTIHSQKMPEEKYLSILLSEEREALLSVGETAEIINLELNQILPIPDLDPHVIGAFNWRQKVIWLVDLPALLDCNPLKNQKRNALNLDAIVIKYRQQRIGIAVVEIKDIIAREIDNKNAKILKAKKVFNLIGR